MSSEMKSLLLKQDELLKLINKAYTNYGKSSKTRKTSSYIETRNESLESLWMKFKDNHDQIVSISDKDIQAELSYFTEDRYEQFEEIYIDYKSKMKDDLKSFTLLTPSVTATQTPSSSGCEVRLPQINLPRFSSGYEEWQAFHDMFVSLIHNNENLSSVQKLHYLKSCLHGEAEYVLKNLSTTDTNYAEAWKQLVRRYNNKRFNTNEVLKRLLSQKQINAESSSAIKQLLDTTSACLKSLTNLHIDTSSWDAIVNHIVVSKMDQESRKQWELQLNQVDTDELPSWEQLQKFMETRFRTIEMLEGVKSTSKSKSFHSSVEEKKKTYIVCAMCNGQHAIYQCKQFVKHTPSERSEYVQKKGLCFNCLAPNHPVKRCHQSTSCRRCGRRHHSLLHMEKEEIKGPPTQEAEDTKPHTPPRESTTIVSNFSKTFSPSEVLLATAVVRAKSVNGSTHLVRALIDQGSEASFITEDTVQILGLKRKPINGLVSGVGDGHTRVRYVVAVRIESRHHPGKSISVNAYVLSTLTSMLPSKVVHTPTWLALERLPLADPDFISPSKIDVLLGAEVYGEILRSGVIKNPSKRLIAQETVFGWIISGKVSPDSTSASRVISLHTQIREDEILKQFWELEKEPQTNEKILTEEEMRCEEIFNITTTRDDDGRLVVRLPFNSDDPQCQYGRSIQIAERRFLSLERRLTKNPELHKEYAKVIQEYKTLNHMKLVPKADIDNPKAVYLPHHAVVLEDKDTTKVRVVFDASCKGVNEVSLNDDLLVGPKLQQDLRHLLLRWRVHRICIIADLVKMYRQVRVHEEDINYQRIVWRLSPEQTLEHYQLLTLTFGTACAPYLAVKALHKLADDEESQCPIAAKITKNDLYIDDLMTGCENETEAVSIFHELNKLMNLGGSQFQKWSSNSNALLEHIGLDNKREIDSVLIKTDKTVKILGLTWNRLDDSFEFAINLPSLVTPVTKRQVISDIARLFDPLGFVAPTIITAKAFIQKLWLSGIEWDQELPEPLLKEWIAYRQELPALTGFSIPRWLCSSKNAKVIELQGFCDASSIAYSAVVFMRVVDEQGAVHVNLIGSKTKVAPVKQVSIPRLELCGAVLLAKLLLELSSVLEVSKEKLHAWTDSTVVLAWLSSHPGRWKTFIGNRVAEILTIMDSSQFSYVRSQDNPADCASRGIKAEELVEFELWQKGPNWLRDKEIVYTKGQFKETNLEEKHAKTVCLTTNVVHNIESEEFLGRFSSLTRLLRVASYCRRFLSCKGKRDETQKTPKFVTTREMQDTLQRLISVVQSEHFKDEIDHIKSHGSVLRRSPLNTLCPIIDSNGIIRTSGRLDRAEMSYERKHPIILPVKSHLTALVIADAHLKTLHGGPQIMMNYIRGTYFIIRGRVQVKKHFRACVTCRRYSSSKRTQLMGQIPEARLKPSKPFKSSGVDYAGPINIRFSPGRGSKAYKGYICLFVCMVTRAIHLEAVSDLTAKGFIAAFRRFTSRRGHCKDLYSDNGTNFVGSNRQLYEMFKNANSTWPNEIIHHLTLETTTWHFIPAQSPNFGGLWEAGVRSVKNHLKRSIGDSTLTYEELTTVLTQIEACLNSRPISTLSDNPCDPLPLTPGHFLVGEPLINVTDEDVCNTVVGLDRWRICQKMVNSFWKRWSKEYVVNLNQRYKWNQKLNEPNINDVIVIREDNIPPAKWLIGRIIQKHPGPDNLTRVVTIKTKNGVLKRPTSTALILLLHLSLHTVDEGLAINPSCSCVRFTATYSKERGTFSSPDYPRPYPPRLDCLLYTFLAAPHEIVELVFTDFDIYKEHLDCIQGDYLKVYSEGGIHGPGPPGVNEYSAWSRVLCGNRADTPPALYSHGPLLVLEFHTDGKESNATGFVGTYRFIDRRNFETDGVRLPDSCDYLFNSQPNRPSHGRLYSPRYPSSYPSNMRCTYHFNGRQHERIKLVFEESFLQKGDDSCLNRADIIKVFDGRTSLSPVLAMLCNEVVGYEILSTGPDLLVQFTSNSDTPGQGFKASYQFQMDDDSSPDAEVNKKSSTTESISGLGPAVSAATSSCHQVFRSDKSKSGKLTSPLHPAPYPQKTQCHYDFLARGRERIRLVFEDFSLQRISDNVIDCESMDSLDIFVYVDGRLEKMASFCGSELPKPIMSNGPKLSVEFRGLYSSRHSRGFKISYSFVEDYGISTGSQLLEFPCAFVYNSSERHRGVVMSPNFPGLYPRDTECNYFFYGNDNERVHLHFTHFDVEGVEPCEAVSASDYIQFSSQMIDTHRQRHCGQLKELLLTSDKNFIRLTFKSNDRLDGTGFKADYIFLRDSEMHSITMPEAEDNGSTYHISKYISVTCLFHVILIIFR